MKATVKNIFEYASKINAKTSIVSSLGSFITKENEAIAESYRNEISSYLPAESLAKKIISNIDVEVFSEKQLWVIAFELQKNESFVNFLTEKNNEIERRENAKKVKPALDVNREIANIIKKSGKKPVDYAKFVKSLNQKMTIENANIFINL